MTRGEKTLVVGVGALSAGLYVAVGVVQAYLVAQDRLHDQLGWLALQLTWAVAIPVGALLLWLGRRLARHAIAAVARAGAVAGLLGGIGCVLANAMLQATWREHWAESYPGIMPAFVPVSIIAVLAAGVVLGAVLGVAGRAPGARRAKMASATLA
jgi:hypothetical protein